MLWVRLHVLGQFGLRQSLRCRDRFRDSLRKFVSSPQVAMHFSPCRRPCLPRPVDF